jgi:hypothetical protein
VSVRTWLTAALLGVLALTGCTADESSTPPTPTEQSTVPQSSPPDTASSPTESASATDGPLVPGTDLLDWQPVEGSVDDTVTRNTSTTVTLAADNKTAVIDGSQQLTVEAGRRGTISHVLLDAQRAVVVIEDPLAERGDQATIVDLASGGTAVIDQSSAPPTTTGGAWAMGAETLVHATVANDTSYCLATVSLESGQGSPGWCAEPHHGFRGAVITETGLSVMGFDDQRPTSCATLLAITGTEATPFEDVTDCQGWDAALLDDGAVWSEVPKPNRQEAAVFRARLGDETFDLGSGLTGSLVWCDAAAYFVRDPETRTDPARLMRFTADGTLSVVYESASQGTAFLTQPRCGGDAITLTSYGDQGNEQVSADLS